jgi:hypothetical protein
MECSANLLVGPVLAQGVPHNDPRSQVLSLRQGPDVLCLFVASADKLPKWSPGLPWRDDPLEPLDLAVLDVSCVQQCAAKLARATPLRNFVDLEEGDTNLDPDIVEERSKLML